MRPPPLPSSTSASRPPSPSGAHPVLPPKVSGWERRAPEIWGGGATVEPARCRCARVCQTTRGASDKVTAMTRLLTDMNIYDSGLEMQLMHRAMMIPQPMIPRILIVEPLQNLLVS